MEEGNERKRLKYDELVEDCRREGWKARCEPIEVGCRGFAARSLCKIYTLLGITGAAKRKAIKSTTEAGERASRWIWIKRSEAWTIATGTQVRRLIKSKTLTLLTSFTALLFLMSISTWSRAKHPHPSAPYRELCKNEPNYTNGTSSSSFTSSLPDSITHNPTPEDITVTCPPSSNQGPFSRLASREM
ncbi:hypothetical protein NFI96_003043 [Prochilodus magdalenae]|nr:hypothetical protein NFI96_003043 [Prochilodus magdalenae]